MLVRAERDKCRVLLHTLRERTIAAGVRNTDVHQRHGKLEVTLTEQKNSVSLFVLGRRAACSWAARRPTCYARRPFLVCCCAKT